MPEAVQSPAAGTARPAVKVAILGTGYAAEHVRHYRSRHDVEVVGVYARSRTSVDRFAREHEIEYATTSWEELLSLPDLTAVSIATPPSTHLEVVRAAAERWLHVLCEKPLALNAPEATQMLELADDAGIVHATNFDFRTSPDMARLHELLEGRYIGELRHAAIHWMGCDHADPAGPWTWRHDRARAGAGVMSDLNHALDHVRWLFGEPARVVADVRVIVSERRDPDSGDARLSDTEDVASFIVVTVDDKPVSAQLSRCATGGGHVVVEAFGSEGMLRMTTPDASTRLATTLVGSRRPGTAEDLSSATAPERVVTSQDLFVEAIQARLAGRPASGVSSSFEDGVSAMRLLDAIRESSAARAWVDVV